GEGGRGGGGAWGGGGEPQPAVVVDGPVGVGPDLRRRCEVEDVALTPAVGRGALEVLEPRRALPRDPAVRQPGGVDEERRPAGSAGGRPRAAPRGPRPPLPPL